MKMRGGWFLFWLASACWILATIAWMSNDPRLSTHAYDAFSTYNTSAGGASQAYAYLHARRGSVQRLLTGIETMPRHATLFRINPRLPMVRAKDEKEARLPVAFFDSTDEEWIRRGGRLIVALSQSYRGVNVELADCGEQTVVFPSSPAVPRLDVTPCRKLGGPQFQQYHALVLNVGEPILARSAIGRGEVILLATPEALSNEYVAENLSLLEWLAARSRPIYFDETAHGLRRDASLGHLLVAEWRLGMAIFLCTLAALAHFWRRSRRLGPADRRATDVRTDAVDLVDSMALLYDRSVDRADALRLYYQGLVRAVHARTGLSGAALERTVRERTAGYDPAPRANDVSREEFQRMLKILNHAYETVGHANTR